MKLETKYRLSAGYFGKLPSYPDFIKYNSGFAEIIGLDKWLREGIVKGKDILKDEWKNTYRNSPRYNFLYPYDDTKNIIFGIMLPGKDQKERDFPFLAFLIMKRNITKLMPLYLMPLGLSKYFDLFDNEFKHSAEGENILFFREEIKKKLLENPLNDFIEYGKYLLETSLKDFYERTLGSFETPLKYGIMENLKKSCIYENPLGSTTANQGFIISLQMINEYTILDICFLLNLLQSFNAGNSKMPVLFWTTEVNKAAVHLFFNKLSAENFCQLLNPQLMPEKNTDYEKTNGDISPEIISMLNNPEMSLTELLNTLQRENKWSLKNWLKIKK